MRHHTKPFLLQDIRMNEYLKGYLYNKVLFSDPVIRRSVAGNLVRLFVFNPNREIIEWKSLESAMSEIFSKYQVSVYLTILILLGTWNEWDF